jgi:hypothetical protein
VNQQGKESVIRVNRLKMAYSQRRHHTWMYWCKMGTQLFRFWKEKISYCCCRFDQLTSI